MARFQLADPFECLNNGEMAEMDPVLQCVHDPVIEITKHRDCFSRNIGNVRRITQPAFQPVQVTAKAETERMDIAMLLQDREQVDPAPLPVNRELFAGPYFM